MIELIENTKDIDELEFINSFSHSGKPVKDLSRIKALLSDLGDRRTALNSFISQARTAKVQWRRCSARSFSAQG